MCIYIHIYIQYIYRLIEHSLKLNKLLLECCKYTLSLLLPLSSLFLPPGSHTVCYCVITVTYLVVKKKEEEKKQKPACFYYMRGNAESNSISVRGGSGVVKITDVAMKTNRTCKYLYDNLLLFFFSFCFFLI